MAFRIDEYNKYYQQLGSDETIIEVEPDDVGRRFKVETIKEDKNSKYEFEMNELKNWFNEYYREHEEKFRRLINLKLKCDDGKDPESELLSLYRIAEEKRKRIQELELIIK